MKQRAKNVLFTAITTARKGLYRTLGFLDKSIIKQKNTVFILSYHSVANDTWRFSVDEAVMKKQLTYLKKNFDIITLAQLHDYLDGKLRITKPSVVLTFDDGYKDILKLKAFFAQQNIQPALFVLATPDKPNIQEMGTEREFLNTSEIKDLIKAKWEIGCHSATHSNLASLSDTEQKKEIIDAKNLLEKDLGIQIPYFAYPRGKYNATTLAYIQKAGFTMAFTMDDGFIKPHANMYTLPRVGIDRTHSFGEFTTAYAPSVVRVRQLIKKSPVGKYL